MPKFVVNIQYKLDYAFFFLVYFFRLIVSSKSDKVERDISCVCAFYVFIPMMHIHTPLTFNSNTLPDISVRNSHILQSRFVMNIISKGMPKINYDLKKSTHLVVKMNGKLSALLFLVFV